MTETTPDQAARDRAIDPSISVLLRAPAGSGKTGVLLLRYLRCLLSVEEPEHVVAITFTRKAAAEIRERVLQSLQQVAHGQAPAETYQRALFEVAAQVLERDRERGWALLDNPARLRVSTFDSFCSAITRRLPLLSGMAHIPTSDDAEVLHHRAILNLFRSLENAEPALKSALGNVLDYANNRLEQLLPLLGNLLAKRDQWVAGVIGGELAAMEQALSTHIETRYRELCAELARFDFQTAIDIAREMAGEGGELGWALECPDIEPADVAHLAPQARLAGLLLSGRDNNRTLRKARGINKNQGFPPKHPCTAAIKAWLENWQDSPEQEALTRALCTLSDLPLPTLPDGSRQLIEDLVLVLKYLLAELHLVFDSEGQLDFSEVAFRAINALRPLDETAGVYGDVLLREDRVRHILVDEMQDTSINQIELLKNLMQGWEPGDGRSLFLCGDLQQSIYLFRGALVTEFESLLELGHFNGHPLTQLQLQANFRSEPALVEWVNRAFIAVFDESYVPAIAQRKSEGSVDVHAFAGSRTATEGAEAERVVQLVREARAAHPDGSIAILVRSRTHLRAIMPALKQAGIDFAGQDIDALGSEPAVADFIALLKAWWHPADRASWVGLLRAPFVGLGWDDCWVLCNRPGLLSETVLDGDAGVGLSQEGRSRIERLRATWQAVADNPRAVEIRWAVPALWYSLGGPACIEPHQQADIDRVLAVLAAHADGGYLRDLAAFERALDKLYAQPAPAPLEIMTIHKAKGLEFDTVIVPGLGNAPRRGESNLFYWRRLEDQLLIAPRPGRDPDPDTEKLYRYAQGLHRADQDREVDRLLYVALTRAKKHLHLVGSAPLAGEEPKPTNDSLLAKLWPSVVAHYAGLEAQPEPEEAITHMQVPLAPRIDPGAAVTINTPVEAAVDAESPLDQLARQARRSVLDDNIEDRAVGLVYHELMRRLGIGRRSMLKDRAALEEAVTARLRHHCHPESGLAAAVTRVLGLCDQTLACEHGQWILQHYATSGAEQSLRRSLGERWQKLVVDRFFVDGDTCWIVDYKTAEGQGERFFDEQRARYADKMVEYKAAIAEAIAGAAAIKHVRAALYFPASQTLVEC